VAWSAASTRRRCPQRAASGSLGTAAQIMSIPSGSGSARRRCSRGQFRPRGGAEGDACGRPLRGQFGAGSAVRPGPVAATRRRTASGPRLLLLSTCSPAATRRWARAVPSAPTAMIPLGMACPLCVCSEPGVTRASLSWSCPRPRASGGAAATPPTATSRRRRTAPPAPAPPPAAPRPPAGAGHAGLRPRGPADPRDLAERGWPGLGAGHRRDAPRGPAPNHGPGPRWWPSRATTWPGRPVARR
jgi:hypothetical protein